MEKKKENFEYRVKNVQLAFPIDYALREYEKEFNQERRAFSEHVLQHTLVKNILWKLTISTKNIEKYPYAMPTIPLEAIPLLDCFYRLGKQGENEKNRYHAVFFCREFDDKYNMNNFWNDLCVELYNFTAPPKNDKEKDFYAFCRHKLFQNEKFASSLLSRICKEEMMARYKMIQRLKNKVELKNQLSILRNCLMNLDRSIFDLQLRIEANSKSLDSVLVTPSSIGELLNSLLSVRQGYKNAGTEPFSYDLPNISLPDGTTLDRAFHDIVRRGKLVNKTKPQLKMARESYMSHLAKKIEMDSNAQDSLELERQYIRLQNYLAAPSSWSSDNLFDKVQERCKQYCRQVIDYCIFEPTPENTFTFPKFQSYSDDRLEFLIDNQMGQVIGLFQQTIQLVAYHNAGKVAANSCKEYEKKNLKHLKDFIKVNVKSEEDSKHLLSKLENLSELVYPISPLNNLVFWDVIGFCSYFERTWEFIYKNTTPLFNKSNCFQNRVDVAYKLWSDGGTAARFFSNEKPTFESLAFPSQEEADQALAICERIASNSDRLFPPFKFWDSISNILQVLLIQILQKIVVDNVPKWVENIKPLLFSSKKPNP